MKLPLLLNSWFLCHTLAYMLNKTPQSTKLTPAQAIDIVSHYHNQTKHHFGRYARSLGYLDWSTQPDPFRRYAGTPLIKLPFMAASEVVYADIYQHNRAVEPVNHTTIGQFLELSLALSAWKEVAGNRWALRINPSSGNLHPTEGYLLINNLAIAPQPIVSHYAPQAHSLEVRAQLTTTQWTALLAGFPAEAFLVGLSSIHWREAWKYGERAFRYCQHDIGHALAALRFSAAILGWQLVLLEDLADSEIALLLGLDRVADFAKAEREQPDLLAVVIPGQLPTTLSLGLPPDAISALAHAQWQGVANQLSSDHVEWEIIDAVANATIKPPTITNPAALSSSRLTSSAFQPQATKATAAEIIKQRRSAVDFDGYTEISAQNFYRILAATLPTGQPPWDAVTWPPAVNLCLFVHRVTELLPGLYILVRDNADIAQLQSHLRPEFSWQKPPLCPPDLPLYFLQEGNCQRLAQQVSCGQAIAGMSAFSLGMVAHFTPTLNALGAWYYRRLFWETGIIGQILYLEAEAIGIRGTGIGCFFDDPVHGVFGFQGTTYQSLYHFTMGGPVEDTRLTTLPPY